MKIDIEKLEYYASEENQLSETVKIANNDEKDNQYLEGKGFPKKSWK